MSVILSSTDKNLRERIRARKIVKRRHKVTASHRSGRLEIYFESNVQLACRTGVIVSGFSGERRRARSERHARRGNSSPVACVSCLAFPVPIACVSCLAFLARFALAFVRLKNA